MDRQTDMMRMTVSESVINRQTDQNRVSIELCTIDKVLASNCAHYVM